VINARIRGDALPTHPSTFISATSGWEIGSRFGDLACIGKPALADKARRCRSTRKACRDFESSRMDSTLRRHTLLVAAILAPLRHFDT
jgi:hypothetical protein